MKQAPALSPNDVERGTLEEFYSRALNAYLEGRDENALQCGNELGCNALAAGAGLLEIFTVHNSILRTVLAGTRSAQDQMQIQNSANSFLAEVLSSYRLAHLTSCEANAALRQLNDNFEQQARRIAHALHDDAGQLLTVVHLALAEMARELPSSTEGKIDQIREYLDKIEEQLRSISHELRPTLLDDLGLLPALKFLARSWSQRTQIPVSVQGGTRERLFPAIETTIYRVVQEALNNAGKHSHASIVRVQLQREPHALRCSVKDDGVGMDLSAVTAETPRRRLGLLGMRERVNAVGGNLMLLSAPGEGTEVVITVPLEA
jgi:signal transduction histidine kinase